MENSVITNKDAKNIGIGRHILSDLVNQGKIERIRPGVYQKAGEVVDDFILISSNSKRIVFSHQTALYLYDLSDRTPNIFHISVPQGYNASHIKKRYENLQVWYIKKDLYPIGITEVETPLGNTVQVYDIERTICDIILDRKKIDKQIYIYGLTRYFKKADKNLRKLIKYSRKFSIEDEIRRYVYLLKKDGKHELNFIVETKDIENESSLRYEEKLRIESARKFFETLKIDGVNVKFEKQLKNDDIESLIRKILLAENTGVSK